MMTEQEIFDTAYLGLKAQGFKPSLKEGKCKYRGDNGMKCAIGHCLTDEELIDNRHSFEGRLSALPEKAQEKLGIANGSSRRVQFLHCIQNAHDSSFNEMSMESDLRKVAADFNLTVPK